MTQFLAFLSIPFVSYCCLWALVFAIFWLLGKAVGKPYLRYAVIAFVVVTALGFLLIALRQA